MSARLLLLCPGQGGQHEDMHAMALADPAAAAFLSAVTLPPGSLFDNLVAQPAVVSATVAMWLALQPRLAALRLAPSLVAGYSVGELSAYCVAGALAPHATVDLAGERARLMNEAAGAAPQTLVAISGLTLSLAATLATSAGYALAIVNGEDSYVAGGPLATAAALQERVRAAGGRPQALPVTVAAHTPLLAAAVAPFAALVAAAPFASLACPVLRGIDGASVIGVDAHGAAASALSRQLAETIAWSDCMDAAAEGGITVALELGPGAALARMLQARHPRIACRSVAEFRTLDGVVRWLAGEMGGEAR